MEHVTHGITLHGDRRASSTSPTTRSPSAREEIDALNVYPVPDGDTGTNMFLTVSAARDALREALGEPTPGSTSATAMAVLARGALLGARGNSGVILSQMLRRARAPARRRRDRRRPRGRRDRRPPWPRRPTRATPPSATPVEGTILTRRRAPRPTRRWRRPATPAARARDVFAAAAAAAREALARTPGAARRCWPRPGSSTPAVAGCASSSTPPRRRPPGDARRRAPRRSAPTASRSPQRSRATTSPRTARPTR